MRAPKPSIETTYRMANGDAVADEYGWVADLEYFDDFEEPVELVEERWTRVAVRTFWKMPDHLYACTADLDCDDDAIAWAQIDGRWEQVCVAHVPAPTPGETR